MICETKSSHFSYWKIGYLFELKTASVRMSSTSGKPVLDRKAAEQINLNVLKRLDSDVEDLLATAGHVALYDFDVSTTQWSRKNVEGSLFVVKRHGSPRFRFIILNKKSADNFVEDVGGGFQCEVKEPYVLYRSSAGGVIGIWFYEEEDCRRIAALLQRIASTFAAPEDETLENSSIQQHKMGALNQQKEFSLLQGGSDVVESKQAEDEDAVFWDRRVKVPDDIPAPGAVSASIAAQPSAAAENVLNRVFASMKVASNSESTSTTVPPTSNVAPSSRQVPAPTQIPLLTPQFLQQKQYEGGSLHERKPVSSSTTPMAEKSGANQGAALLRSLQSSGKNADKELPIKFSEVSRNDNAIVDKSRQVSALMRSLAENEVFCRELAREMDRCGILN